MTELGITEDYRRRKASLTEAATGGALLGAGMGVKAGLDRRARRYGSPSAPRAVLREIGHAPKRPYAALFHKPSPGRAVGGWKTHVHGPDLAGRAGARGLQAVGLPLAAYGVYNATRKRPAKVKPVPRAELAEHVVRTAAYVPQIQAGQEKLTKALAAEVARAGARPARYVTYDTMMDRMGVSPKLRELYKRKRAERFTKPASSMFGKLLTQHEQRQLNRHRTIGRTTSIAGGVLGLTALGLRAPAGAKAIAGKVPGKLVRRVAGTEAAATKHSNTLGIAAIGGGSIGSFNYAAQQKLERKATIPVVATTSVVKANRLWQPPSTGSMTHRGGAGYYHPSAQQVAESKARRGVQQSQARLKRVLSDNPDTPLGGGRRIPLVAHWRSAGDLPGKTAAAALVSAGAVTAIEHRRKRLSKSDASSTSAGAALGAVAGQGAAYTAMRVGGQAAKATLKQRRATRGVSRNEAATWRKHSAKYGAYDRRSYVKYPRSLPDWRGHRALAFKNNPKVETAALVAGTMAGAAYGANRLSKARKDQQASGSAIAGGGGVVAGLGLVGGGIPGFRSDSDTKANLRRGSWAQRTGAAASSGRGGIFGYRTDAHIGAMHRFEDDPKVYGSGPTSRVNHFARGRTAGKIEPERVIIRHMKRGRAASAAALLGGGALTAYGVHRARGGQIRKDRRDVDAYHGALLGVGGTTAAAAVAGDRLFTHQARKWSGRAAASQAEAARLVPNLRPGMSSETAYKQPRTFAGKSNVTAEAAGRARGAATQQRYFAHVYRGTAKVARKLRAPALATAAVGGGGLLLSRRKASVRKADQHDDAFLRGYKQRISPKAESGYRRLKHDRNEARVQAVGAGTMAGLGGWLTHHELTSRPVTKPAAVIAAASTVASTMSMAQSADKARRYTAHIKPIKARARSRRAQGLYGPGRGRSPIDTSSKQAKAYNLAKAMGAAPMAVSKLNEARQDKAYAIGAHAERTMGRTSKLSPLRDDRAWKAAADKYTRSFRVLGVARRHPRPLAGIR